MKLKMLAAAFALALAASGGAVAQTKLKFAHVYEVSEPYHTAAVWAAGEIAKRTNNRYSVDVFPASQLGKESDINQGLTLGTVDMIIHGPAVRRAQLRPDFYRRRAVHIPRFRSLEEVLHLQAVRRTGRRLPEGDRRQQGGGGHLLRRAPRHRQQGDQHARGHEEPEDPRTGRAALHAVPARGRRQSDADRFCRGLSGAAEQDGGC